MKTTRPRRGNRLHWLFLLAAGGLTAAACAGSGTAGTACDPVRPHQAGRSVESLDVDGRERMFLLDVPSSYDGVTGLPLLIGYHAASLGPDALMVLADFVPVEEFAPAGSTTNGILGAWPADLDETMGRVLIGELQKELCVDDTRIYAAGFAAGARRVSELAGSMSDQLAAVGLINGGKLPNPTEDMRPVPMIAHTGGHATGGPSETLTTWWAEHNGCETDPSVEEPADAVTVTRWSTCTNDADVELWVLTDMGQQVAAPDCGFVPEALRGVCYESPEFSMWAAFRPFFETHHRPSHDD